MTTRIVLRLTAALMLFAPLGARAALPKLVVLIAIDQFRADYLTRYESEFLPATRDGGKPGGFRYLMDKGAYFPEAHTVHSPNVTAVGHATMLTGALPYLHGIVANYWFDQVQRERHYCVEDPDAQVIGGATGPHTGRSPRNLLVSTVGDELKNAFAGKPRVVSIAIKDRAAILMGGHRADLAVWFDERAGGWVTSAYYLHDTKPKPELPAWIASWNDKRTQYIKDRVPHEWTLLAPESHYANSTVMPPESVGEAHGLGKKFPHPIAGKTPEFISSPFGNTYTLDTALAAVKAMRLGNGSAPDLLAVSLSSFDILGHTYGPFAREMQDTTMRLDRALADFLDALAAQVPGGMSRIVVALTADHGVQVNPLYAEKVGLPGSVVLMPDLTDKLNARLRTQFGFSDSEKPVAFIFEDNIFFDQSVVDKKGKPSAELARDLAQWLRAQPYVAAAYAKEDVLEGRIAANSVSARMAASVHATRSGDVVIAMRPGHLSLDEFHDFGGTGHESPTAQDASIPILFAGEPFRPGRYHSEATMLDIAATLSTVLGIIPPSGCEGHTLAAALKAR